MFTNRFSNIDNYRSKNECSNCIFLQLTIVLLLLLFFVMHKQNVINSSLRKAQAVGGCVIKNKMQRNIFCVKYCSKHFIFFWLNLVATIYNLQKINRCHFEFVIIFFNFSICLSEYFDLTLCGTCPNA